MRTRYRSLAILACALMPRSAPAQFLDFGAQCFPGSFEACVSVAVGWHYDAESGGTFIKVYAANLQGSAVHRDEYHDFQFMQFRNFDWTGQSMEYYLARGIPPYVIPHGDAGSFFGEPEIQGYSDWNGGGIELSVAPASNGQSFWGCNDGSSLYPSFGYMWTCGGYVEIRTFMPGEVVFTGASNVRMGMAAYDLQGNAIGSSSCITGDTCTVTSTPEPATMVLTGSGLAALAAARTRRRKRAAA